MTHYGQEGKHYTKSGNKVTLNVAAFEADIAQAGNWLNVYQVFTPDEPNVLGLELIDSRISEHDRCHSEESRQLSRKITHCHR